MTEISKIVCIDTTWIDNRIKFIEKNRDEVKRFETEAYNMLAIVATELKLVKSELSALLPLLEQTHVEIVRSGFISDGDDKWTDEDEVKVRQHVNEYLLIKTFQL